ncbi:serine-rich adhesin for platelets-like [Branchiostoma lanceolatum]|uniref:serine-rich adhesin for platelets-like n=1 Tax=Branchiostoma lanceolatum TaxID=7740 RepID=UPI003453A246
MEKKKKEKSRARKKKNKIAPSEMKAEVQQQLGSSQRNHGESSAQVQVVNSSPESGAVHSTIQGSYNKEPGKGIPQESEERGIIDNRISESSSSSGSAGHTDGLTVESLAPGTKSSVPSDVQLPGGSGTSKHVSVVKKKKKKKRGRSRSRKRSLESGVGSSHPFGSKNFSKTKGSSRRRSMQMEFAKLTARAMLMALSHSPLTSGGGRRVDMPVHSQTPTDRTEKTQPLDSGFSTKERTTSPQKVTDSSGFKYHVKKMNIDKGERKGAVSSGNKGLDHQSETLCHPGAFSTKDRNGSLVNQGTKHVNTVMKGEIHMERKTSEPDVIQASCARTALPSDTSSSSSESSSGEESSSEDELSLRKSLAQTKLSDVGKQNKVFKIPSSVAASHTNGENPSAKGKHPANGKQGKVKKSKKSGTDKCGKKKEYKIKTSYVTPTDVATDSKATKKIRKKQDADVSKSVCRSEKLKEAFKKEGMSRSPQTFGSAYTSSLANLIALSRLVQEDKTVASTEHKKKRKKKMGSKRAKIETTVLGPGENSYHEAQSKMGNAPGDVKAGVPKAHKEGKKNKGTGKEHTTTSHTGDKEPSSCLETLANQNSHSMGSDLANKPTVQSTAPDSVMSSVREGKGMAPSQSGASGSRNKEKSGVSKKKITKKRRKEGTSISKNLKKKVGDIGKRTFTSTSQTVIQSPESLKCANVQNPSVSQKDGHDTYTTTKSKTVFNVTQTVKDDSSAQVKVDVAFTDTTSRETLGATSDMPKSNIPDTEKPALSTVGTKKSTHTGILKPTAGTNRLKTNATSIPHSTASTSKLSSNATAVPNSTDILVFNPSIAVTSNVTSNVTAKEESHDVDTNRSKLDHSTSESDAMYSTADEDSCIVSTTDDTQLMDITGTGRQSTSSKDKLKSALVAGMQGTITGANDSITADTTGKDGDKFDETESDISATTDKDDSCIIIIDTPEKQQESSSHEPTTASTSTMSDGISEPETVTKTNTNLHCQSSQVTKEVSVQLTRLEDEIMMYLLNKPKSTNTKEEKNTAMTKASKEVQDGERMVEDDKAGSDRTLSQDNETLVEQYDRKDDKTERNTVSQLPQQESCPQSVLAIAADADESRGDEADRHTVTRTPNIEKSPDSSQETLLVVTTSKNSTIEDCCPHLPQNSCPQCLSGSKEEHIEQEFDKSNKSCPEADNAITTQDKNVSSGKATDITSDDLDLPPSGKIGDISYTVDEIDLNEEPSNTDKSKEGENSRHGINSTPCKTTTYEVQDSVRQELQVEADTSTSNTIDSEINLEVLTTGNQHNNPCQEKREQRAHLEETIQRVWEKCGFKSLPSTVTDTNTMETSEEEPRVSLHNSNEADDHDVILAPGTNINASSKPPSESGLVQNDIGRPNSKFTEKSLEMSETESIGPCSSTTAATSTYMDTDDLQLSGKVSSIQTAVEAEENTSCMDSLEDSLLSMQSQESVEMFANMFVNAIYGEGEPGHKSTLPWEVYTSSSDSEVSTGSDTSSEESVDSEENDEQNDCSVSDNPEEESNKENDPVSPANVQTLSDFEDNHNDTVITKDSASGWDGSVPSKDGATENENSNQPRGQSSNAVANSSKGSNSHNDVSPLTSQQTETVFVTEDDLDLGAVSELEDATSDDESSTYSFIPGDHSQGPEVPEDDVEDFLESVDISPIIKSANTVGGTVCQKKTCRRSLFEYQGGNGVSVVPKEEMQGDLHLVLNTSKSSEEDWSTPLKPLVADYSSPGDTRQEEETLEVFKPFSQDVEGDQLLSDYMSGIEPILKDHFEPTKGPAFEEEIAPKQNNQKCAESKAKDQEKYKIGCTIVNVKEHLRGTKYRRNRNTRH